MEILKFKTDLTTEWQKNYSLDGDADYEFVSSYKIMQTSDQGFMVAGTATVYSTADSSGTAQFVLRTDKTGNLIFAKRYSAYGTKDMYDIVPTQDGNYVFLALTNETSKADTAQLTKIKPDGSVVWSKYLVDDNLSVFPVALLASSDGGFVITGDVFDLEPSTRTDNMFMTKYDAAGNLIWSKEITAPGNNESYGYAVTEDKDGGYLFAGEYDTFDDDAHEEYDTSYGYIVKTNNAGVLQWTKTFEPSYEGYTSFGSLIKTLDGGYAASGEVYLYDAENDIEQDGGFIYKFNSNFDLCNESPGSKGSLMSVCKSLQANVTASDLPISVFDAELSFENAGTIDNVCKTALPLQLLSFNATLQNKSVSINWQTANEVNTDYFVVERSANGSSFSALQKIAAKGSSSLTQTYNTNDLQPLQGTSYYRLQQVDKDGRTTYSSIAKVVVMSNGTIVISPNPVQSNIRVIVQSHANSSLTLQVMDMKGNALATQKRSVSEGRNEVNIPAASLAKGVYILKVMDKGSVQTIRFVKE